MKENNKTMLFKDYKEYLSLSSNSKCLLTLLMFPNTRNAKKKHKYTNKKLANETEIDPEDYPIVEIPELIVIMSRVNKMVKNKEMCKSFERINFYDLKHKLIKLILEDHRNYISEIADEGNYYCFSICNHNFHQPKTNFGELKIKTDISREYREPINTEINFDSKLYFQFIINALILVDERSSSLNERSRDEVWMITKIYTKDLSKEFFGLYGTLEKANNAILEEGETKDYKFKVTKEIIR